MADKLRGIGVGYFSKPICLGLRLFGLWISGFALIGAAPLTQADMGPPPTWEQAVALGNAAVLARLIDPDSAKIEWPYNFDGGSLKALLGKTRAGYWTCGFVNAKNRMGGFTGRNWFLILINSGQVVSLEIGESDGIDAATTTCTAAAKKGELKPAPGPAPAGPIAASVPSTAALAAMAAQTAQAAAAKGGLGISFVPSPFGAMLTAVAADSPAARSGLKAGEVIESVNGISLRGFDLPTMARVLQNSPMSPTLAIIGVGDVTVVRPHK